MIQIDFAEVEIEQLNFERYHYPHPKVQIKMEAVYLKSLGLSHHEICRICRISKTTLTVYLRQYQLGGIEALKQLGYQGNQSQLNEYADSLKAYFQKNLPRTSAEAQAIIEELTGIKRSPTQVKAFLKKLGLRCRKVGFVPGKVTSPQKIEKQEIFRQQQLEPRLAEAARGERCVFFVDAAHFIHRAYLGFLWCFSRVFIASPSGRKRFNVLGAINAVTKEVVTVTNETYINAESFCQLLLKLTQLKLTIPITIILDNARYQKCKVVQNLAESLEIELLYLPSYSPHLNLIERFWRFIRNQCLYSKYYLDFASFKEAISTCIDKANTEYKEKLESLLSWNFQSFKKVQISAA